MQKSSEVSLEMSRFATVYNPITVSDIPPSILLTQDVEEDIERIGKVVYEKLWTVFIYDGTAKIIIVPGYRLFISYNSERIGWIVTTKKWGNPHVIFNIGVINEFIFDPYI